LALIKTAKRPSLVPAATFSVVVDRSIRADEERKRTKSHVLEMIAKLKQRGQTLLMQRRMCKKHNEELHLYCITCQTLNCSDGTVNDHHGQNCDLLTEVVDAHAAELVQHADDVETLERTLEHHIASLKLLEDMQLPGVETGRTSASRAALVNALHGRETELVREVEEMCARNSMTLAVQCETLVNAVASMSSGIEQARRTAGLRIRLTSTG